MIFRPFRTTNTTQVLFEYNGELIPIESFLLLAKNILFREIIYKFVIITGHLIAFQNEDKEYRYIVEKLEINFYRLSTQESTINVRHKMVDIDSWKIIFDHVVHFKPYTREYTLKNNQIIERKTEDEVIYMTIVTTDTLYIKLKIMK